MKYGFASGARRSFVSFRVAACAGALAMVSGGWTADATAGNVLRCPNPEIRSVSVGFKDFVPLAGGQVLAVGSFVEVDGQHHLSLVVLDANGDPIADGAPDVDGFVENVERGADGYVYVAGRFSRVGDVAQRNLARLVEVNGRLVVDSGWTPLLPADHEHIRGLAVSATHAYVAPYGAITEISLTTGAIGRQLEPAQPMQINAIGLSEDGTDLFAAGFPLGTPSRLPFQRIDLDTGQGDATWGDFQFSTYAGSRSGWVVTADGPGHVLLGGQFTLQSALTHENLVRISLNGVIDESFVTAPNGLVRDIEKLQDGDTLINGFFGKVGSQNLASGVARLGPGGELRAFNAGSGIVIDVQAAAASDADTVVSVETRPLGSALVWRDATTGVDVSPTSPPVFRAWASINHIGQSGSYVTLSGGEFVAGRPNQNLTLLGPGGGVVALPTLGVATDSFSPATPVHNGIVALRITQGSTALTRISLSSGSIDPAWQPVPMTQVRQLVHEPLGDHVYVVGNFTVGHGDHIHQNLLRVHASGAGGIDDGWRPSSFPSVNTAEPLVLHEGYAYWISATITRIPLTGPAIADTSWEPNLDSIRANAIGVDRNSDEILVAGTNLLGNAFRLARVPINDAAGIVIFDHPGVAATVVMSDVEVGDDGSVYVAAQRIGGTKHVLRLLQQGQVADTTWQDAPDNPVVQLARLVDGNILMAGPFSSAGGLLRSGVAAFGSAQMIHRSDFGDPCAAQTPIP